MTLLPWIPVTLKTTVAGPKMFGLGPPGPLTKEKIKVRVVLKCLIVRVKGQQSLIQCLLAEIVQLFI